jgi:hypothetical protein
VKSYLSFWPWRDRVVYMQAQGYWVLANWLLADLGGGAECRDVALASTDHVLAAQRADGYWDYPKREWKGRIVTVEGCFATLALLESFANTHHRPYLDAAERWYEYVVNCVKFQGHDGVLAVNYYSNRAAGMVPNNSTLLLQMLARLAKLSGEDRFLETCPGMVAFLKRVQLASGELPYAVSDLAGNGRIHFLCYQYNAFELLDLAEYYEMTSDQNVWPVMERLASYLSAGLTERGAARYDCFHGTPEVIYYTSAVASALSRATELGIGDFRRQADAGADRVLSQQRPDGGFRFFSTANYGCLTDRRSYPRQLAMILYQFLRRSQARDPVSLASA